MVSDEKSKQGHLQFGGKVIKSIKIYESFDILWQVLKSSTDDCCHERNNVLKIGTRLAILCWREP